MNTRLSTRLSTRLGMRLGMRTVTDVTCLGCGCACDDVDVVVEGDRIVEARNACVLGVEWFGDGRVPARVRVAGREAPMTHAVAIATQLLVDARRALVYLTPGISCEAQRASAAIADLLGGLLDSATTATALSPVLVSQERGQASATLGEIRNRADVVVFWAVDTDARYPRFASRYAPEPSGTHVPDGRRSRKVVAVDVAQSTGPADADLRFTVRPADEVATLTALRALVSRPADSLVRFETATGTAWETARALAPTLLDGRYVALVYDAEPDERAARSPGRFDALAALAQSLNDATRCAAIALRAGGNRSGADAMLTAQTGFPLAIDFTRGYPRYRPHDGSAQPSLARGEIDVALVVGDAAFLPGSVATALGNTRCVVIGPRASDSPLGAAGIAIDTGVAGIHSSGVALRTDDVALPVRAVVPGPPSPESVVTSIVTALRRRVFPDVGADWRETLTGAAP